MAQQNTREAHTQQRARDIIISSVTSWGAGRQQTAGSAAYSDANGLMTLEESRANKEGKTVYENGGGPAEELKLEKDRTSLKTREKEEEVVVMRGKCEEVCLFNHNNLCLFTQYQ